MSLDLPVSRCSCGLPPNSWGEDGWHIRCITDPSSPDFRWGDTEVYERCPAYVDRSSREKVYA
jgi:hypothetical protein